MVANMAAIAECTVLALFAVHLTFFAVPIVKIEAFDAVCTTEFVLAIPTVFSAK
jgi:hypothetical protein